MVTQEDKDKIIAKIERDGKGARGKKELIKFFKGEKLTVRQALIAQCYQCLGYYADGIGDCECQMCSLYIYMPYNKNKQKKELTDEQKAKLTKQLHNDD
jgi:hypothetical protein